MVLVRACIRSHGFTLIEILVVLGLIAVLLSLGLTMNMNTFKDYLFRNDKNSVIVALQKARSQAINNLCVGPDCGSGLPHGVHFEKGFFTIFQGQIYSDDDPANERSDFDYGEFYVSGLTNVVFSELTADVTQPGELLLNDNSGRVSKITVNSQGGISWTN